MRQGSVFDNFCQVFGLVLEISLALSIQKWHRAQRSKVYVRKIILSKNQLKRTERAGVLQLLRLTSGVNFLRIFMKKWCFPNRSRITLGRSWVQSIKKRQRDDKISTLRPPEIFPKITEKLAHMKSFWTLFSQISHAGACVAWRRASRGSSNDS